MTIPGKGSKTNSIRSLLRGGKPLLWQFDGGYVSLDANGAPTGWNYYVTDHLGSTRMVVVQNVIHLYELIISYSV